MLTNADIAELLAREEEQAKQPLQRALRRAFLWPVEVEEMYRKTEDLDATADKLSSTADYVREHDVNTMMADVETVVKRNPGRSLLVGERAAPFTV